MDILYYADLAYNKVKKQFDKTVTYLKAGDFHSADVKKMPNTGYYRAKLDDTDRLLFKIGEFEGKKYIFLLEVILNHDYDKSRFLNGAEIDESKLVSVKDEKSLVKEDITQIGFINKKQSSFHILDKILSFDDTQGEILHLPAPLIVIGSAGSGKTALTLEKVKTLKGKVLYVTLSPYLVENSRNLYYSFDYENANQEVEFLSFFEYLSMLEVPKGKEIDFRAFEQWIVRYKQSHKIKDSYKVFEEFKGVLTGSIVDKPYLSKDEYLNLGIKQSIFSAAEREILYDLFLKYIDYLAESPYFDSNILAFEYLKKVEKDYDFVVVDEVQDITNVQLFLIIKALKYPTSFILCGDANQIVHPNFFSWSQLKSMFYKQELQANIIRVLAANYRNTPEVTQIANQLLRIKNARFGSIDKESTFLVESRSQHKGEVAFLENLPKTKTELNDKTKRSTRFAVLVMRNEDKLNAKKFFDTPLLFSVQEAKGLEYENIILFNIISQYEKEFRELTNGVTQADLEGEIEYARSRDKADKSLDEYKFYVNSLYVAMTRAVKNLYVIETNKKHNLLAFLGLTEFKQHTNVQNQSSSSEDWQKEARRLEMQGKQEQADAIRQDILKITPVPWDVITRENYHELLGQALHPTIFHKKSKDRIFEYALYYEENGIIEDLSMLKYRPADRPVEAAAEMRRKWFAEYQQDSVKMLLPKLQKHGVDFRNPMNFTPLMCAFKHNAVQIATHLLENGAKVELTDNNARNIFHIILLNAAVIDGKLYDQKNNKDAEKECKERLAKIKEYFNPQKYSPTPEQKASLEKEQANVKEKLTKLTNALTWRASDVELHYKKKVLARFYAKLKTESLKLKIGSRLLKIDHHQAEYFIFNYMFATLRARMISIGKATLSFDMPIVAYQTADFLTLYENMPTQVMPEYRAQRTYISSILSKNELFREDKYSKKLFLRLKQGEYVINPQVEMQVQGEWAKVYDLLGEPEISLRYAKNGNYFFNLFEFMSDRIAKNPTQKVTQMDFYHYERELEMKRRNLSFTPRK